MFTRLKALFSGNAQVSPASFTLQAAPNPPVAEATKAILKPSAQQVHDAGQKAHDEIASWIELWAAGRKSDIPERYRPLFSHYLLAFTQNETVTSDRHYTTLRKTRTIEILAAWGYSEPTQ